MPTPQPRVTVTTAVHPAVDGEPGEDRVFTTPNAVIVLDGASQATTTAHDGGWLADTLGRELRIRLVVDPTGDLVTALAQSIAAVAQCHGLTPGVAPSTTIAIARWSVEAVDALVLGDTARHRRTPQR